MSKIQEETNKARETFNEMIKGFTLLSETDLDKEQYDILYGLLGCMSELNQTLLAINVEDILFNGRQPSLQN